MIIDSRRYQVVSQFLLPFVLFVFIGLASCADDPIVEPEPEEQQQPGSDPDPEEEEENPGQEPDPVEKPSVVLTGQILDQESGEPIENVLIVGFHHGTFITNFEVRYGTEVVLGKTDNCGRFEVGLPDSIKGINVHGGSDSTKVHLQLRRDDFGSKDVSANFESATQTYVMTYTPKREAFFAELYAVKSEDRKSVTIGWEVYSLVYKYSCQSGSYVLCTKTSNGSISIFREGMAGAIETIEVGSKQVWTDDNVPSQDLTYAVTANDNSVTMFQLDLERDETDTVFAVKRLELPVLNHCQ